MLAARPSPASSFWRCHASRGRRRRGQDSNHRHGAHGQLSRGRGMLPKRPGGCRFGHGTPVQGCVKLHTACPRVVSRLAERGVRVASSSLRRGTGRARSHAGLQMPWRCTRLWRLDHLLLHIRHAHAAGLPAHGRTDRVTGKRPACRRIAQCVRSGIRPCAAGGVPEVIPFARGRTLDTGC